MNTHRQQCKTEELPTLISRLRNTGCVIINFGSFNGLSYVEYTDKPVEDPVLKVKTQFKQILEKLGAWDDWLKYMKIATERDTDKNYKITYLNALFESGEYSRIIKASFYFQDTDQTGSYWYDICEKIDEKVSILEELDAETY